MQLSPGSAKAARQHRDGVDTTSTSALNLVDVKHDLINLQRSFII